MLEFGRGESSTTDPNVLIANAMTNITDSVVSLYSEGATHFLFLNLPDIGKTPAYNKRTPEEIAGVTKLVQAYNSALAAAIEKIEVDLAGITIYSFDEFAYMNEMISNNAFINVTDTYMEEDEEGNKTGNINGEAEDYLFWDHIHPMTRAHEMVADELNKTLFSVSSHSSSSSCFIGSINGQINGSVPKYLFLILTSLFAGIAVSSRFLKKNCKK